MDDLFTTQNNASSPPPSPAGAPPPFSDPHILQKALEKMHTLVKGNGVALENVSITLEPGDTLKLHNITAYTSLKPFAEKLTKTEPGKAMKGDVLPALPDALEKATQQCINDIISNHALRQQLIQPVLDRADHGFGISNQQIKFPKLGKNVVQHEDCTTCKGLGKSDCLKCHSLGTITCTNCQGRRQTICPRCRGTTKIHTGKGTIPCQFCKADGRVICKKCAGKGKLKCPACAALGFIKCRNCATTGSISHLTHIDISALATFTFDQAGLPASLVKMIKNHASRMASKGLLRISIPPPPPSHATPLIGPLNSDNALHNNIIPLPYNVTCPYGTITFHFKDRAIPATLLGYEATLLNCPPFLDELTIKGQNALLAAANKHSHVAKHIRYAAKYALIRHILAATLRYKNQKKAILSLKSKYTTGISDEKLSQLLAAAELALRNMTRSARTAGLSIGLILFTAVCVEYFIGGGRFLLNAYGAKELYLSIIDACLILLGFMMGASAAKLCGHWSQQRALKAYVPGKILLKSLPTTGGSKWWALGLAILIMGGTILSSILLHTGHTPLWALYLLKGI
jgi:hypothetical protein